MDAAKTGTPVLLRLPRHRSKSVRHPAPQKLIAARSDKVAKATVEDLGQLKPFVSCHHSNVPCFIHIRFQSSCLAMWVGSLVFWFFFQASPSLSVRSGQNLPFVPAKFLTTCGQGATHNAFLGSALMPACRSESRDAESQNKGQRRNRASQVPSLTSVQGLRKSLRHRNLLNAAQKLRQQVLPALEELFGTRRPWNKT